MIGIFILEYSMLLEQKWLLDDIDFAYNFTALEEL